MMQQINTDLKVIAYVSLLLTLVLTGCNGNSLAEVEPAPNTPTQSKVTNVVLTTVAAQDIKDTFTLPGTLEAWENLTLAAEMAGPIHWIGPKEGDRVKKGEAIMRIDPERREAELARDQVDYELQQKRMERLGSLAERNLVSQQEYEDARKSFEQAQAQLRLSQVAVKKSTLRSPVDGFLDELLVDRGEYVSEGTAAAVVMQVERLWARVDVPEKDIFDLKVGEGANVFAASFQMSDTPGLPGEIIHLSYQADPATRTYKAKVAVDNSSGTLRPGMIVKVGFVRQQLPQIIAAPLYALVDREGAKVVYVEQDGIARLRQIKIGTIIGDQAVITEGLSAGDRLIVKGQQLVSDGARVTEERI